ncbi:MULTISPECIES: 4-hydroxy-tetrahydrodipicolinate synthase [Sporosarcina]|uniref:4-hydroxy-tetrahydrodipicolinate synthase n=1 Tax=Sporosarcina TaxID=1569 RepID=UPI000590AC6B|nr:MULTISPECIES: 4-hydroxy-tetrahydrodipicolinate synthase [Sporosarcina]WJY26080.1 4-hydroxy-tetrahydrodipicolinate synthase [Sporosarcina sp. 0.2-SM1T-5]
MNFGQLITAMVTPFNAQEDIDFTAAEELIEHLIATGTDALVVAGTTGESPTLTASEKAALFRHTVRCAGGRIPVIAGTGTNSTRESIELTRAAEEAGADGVMLVVPYYNKPCQEGMYAHFKAIAESTSLPVMLYNIPGRSTVNLEIETIVKLAEIPNITAIKEAGGSLETMASIIEQTPAGFAVYSGDDALTLPALTIGGAGVVSVAAHLIGPEMKAMMHTAESGRFEEAASLHRSLLPLMKELFKAPNPSPVKAALNLQGLPAGTVRLPMVPLTDRQQQSLANVLDDLNCKATA